MMTIKDLHDQNLILFKAITGSRAYGLDTAASDTDIKGVFYLPKNVFYGLSYIAQINNDSHDEVYYELGRFVELLSKNNPGAMELLASASASILINHPLMANFQFKKLLNMGLIDSFVQYAMQQVKKAKGLNKKINNPHVGARKSLLDFAYIMSSGKSYPVESWLQDHKLKSHFCGLIKLNHCKNVFALYYDKNEQGLYRGIMAKADSHEVALSSIAKGEETLALLFVNHEAYSSYCKDFKAYKEWEKKRNVMRYAGTVAHGQGYDAKNMMHTIRLMEVARDLLLKGELILKRPNREALLEIKSGRWTYDELCRKVEVIQCEIDEMYFESSFPKSVDTTYLEKSLLQIRESLYQ